MMELADVLDSKSSGSDTVRVRPPLPAPTKKSTALCGALFRCRLWRGAAPRSTLKILQRHDRRREERYAFFQSREAT